MSISDMIVVMKAGVVHQIGKPQEVYDNPANLFVAKFLGTPPINVFLGEVKQEKLYIGDCAVLDVAGVADQKVTVGIRPEGFIPDENGPLSCELKAVEVTGRDTTIVTTHPCSTNTEIRSIVNAEYTVNTAANTVKYSLKPHKVKLFSAEDETAILFGTRV